MSKSPVSPITIPRSLSLVFAAGQKVAVHPVVADPEVGAEVVGRLGEAVLAGDVDVLEVGLREAFEGRIALDREPPGAHHDEGARRGDHAGRERPAGLAEAGIGLGVERTTDAAEETQGEGVALLLLGGGERRRDGGQRGRQTTASAIFSLKAISSRDADARWAASKAGSASIAAAVSVLEQWCHLHLLTQREAAPSPCAHCSTFSTSSGPAIASPAASSFRPRTAPPPPGPGGAA